MSKTKYINCRVDEDFKECIDAILNEINKGLFNEPKKNYRYAFELLKDLYINNPNYYDVILEVELKQKLKKLTQERDYIDYQIAETQKELNAISERINQPVDHDREINLTPALEKAIGILKNNCNQKNISTYEDIPQEMITAIANTCKVRKDDLITLAKREF